MKTRGHWVFASVTTALVIAIAVLLLESGQMPGKYRLRPGDRELAARGEQIYRNHCAACHGANLEGQANWRQRGADGRLPAPPHDASGHTWHHPDDVLFKMTKYGAASLAKLKDYNTAMPVYDGVLSDEEIIAVLSWIKAQWPSELQARHDEINQQRRR